MMSANRQSLFRLFVANKLTDAGLKISTLLFKMIFHYIESKTNIPDWCIEELAGNGGYAPGSVAAAPRGLRVQLCCACIRMWGTRNHYLSGPYKVYEKDADVVEKCRKCLTLEHVGVFFGIL
jgi:hypothetical protein